MNSSKNPIIPIIQKSISFHGTTLIAIHANDGFIYILERSLFEAFGIPYSDNRRRIKQFGVADKLYKIGSVNMEQGITKRSIFLRLDLLPLWIAGLIVCSDSIDDKTRKKFELYLNKAAKTLWEDFRGSTLSTEIEFYKFMYQDSDVEQTYRRLCHHQTGHFVPTIEDLTTRISSEEQQCLLQAIRIVAGALPKETKGNKIGTALGTLCERYGIINLKQMPHIWYPDALNWLANWYKDLIGLTNDEADLRA